MYFLNSLHDMCCILLYCTILYYYILQYYTLVQMMKLTPDKRKRSGISLSAPWMDRLEKCAEFDRQPSLASEVKLLIEDRENLEKNNSRLPSDGELEEKKK